MSFVIIWDTPPGDLNATLALQPLQEQLHLHFRRIRMTNAFSKLFREYQKPECTILSDISPQNAPNTTRYAPVEYESLEDFYDMDIPPMIILSSSTESIITITDED